MNETRVSVINAFVLEAAKGEFSILENIRDDFVTSPR